MAPEVRILPSHARHAAANYYVDDRQSDMWAAYFEPASAVGMRPLPPGTAPGQQLQLKCTGLSLAAFAPPLTPRAAAPVKLLISQPTPISFLAEFQIGKGVGALESRQIACAQS